MSSKESPTRIRILDTTRRLMEQKGGEGVRMSDIARAAGVSRQAIYLHFDTRAALLVATTRHMDAALGVQARLKPSRTAKTGAERIRAFIAFWGSYVPEIHPVAHALMAVQDSDAAAAEAWASRMQAVREGCQAAIEALERDGQLAPGWTVRTATDLFWAMLSVRVWEQLTKDCGWSEADYITRMQAQALATFSTGEPAQI